MISKGFYFSSKIEKNKGDRDFKYSTSKLDAEKKPIQVQLAELDDYCPITQA